MTARKKYFSIIILTSLALSGLLSVFGCSNQGNTAKPPPIAPAQPDPWTDTVLKADLIALTTVTGKEYEVVTRVSSVSGNTTVKFAYTIFTLSVEKTIKGDPAIKEVLIKKPGGPIGDLFQNPTEGYFTVGDRMLRGFRHEHDKFYSVLPEVVSLEFSTGGKSDVGFEEAIGRIIKIMISQNIPVALSPSEWPPLPTGPVQRPDS